MKKSKVETLRREYTLQGLSKAGMEQDPFRQFTRWFSQAAEAGLIDVNAMTLATADQDGAPSARIVLLKGYDDRGFYFYTNYESRKGQELKVNPHVALCLYWPQLERQVRIEGRVEKTSREQSEKYFHKRPRESQIGAWASSQSRKIQDRQTLLKRFSELKEQFDSQTVPLPDFWGGYCVIPRRIEFWQGRPGRLHDRLQYEKEGDSWVLKRLAP